MVVGNILTVEGQAVAKDLGEAAIFVELDVTSEEAWKNAVETTLARLSKLDVLVNNASLKEQICLR